MKIYHYVNATSASVQARVLIVSCLILSSLVTGLPGNIQGNCAEVKPGDVITPENAAKVKNLLSPGVYYKVVNGCP